MLHSQLIFLLDLNALCPIISELSFSVFIMMNSGFIVQWQRLIGVFRQRFQINISIGWVSIDRRQLQIAVKIPSVKSRQGKTVAIASQRRSCCRWVNIRAYRRSWRGRIHVFEDLGQFGVRYSASEISYAYAQVLFAFDYERLYFGVGFCCLAVVLDDGSHCVFVKLECYVV